jgi:hypothetical protein
MKVLRIKYLLLISMGLLGFIGTQVRAENHLIFLDGYLGWHNSLPPYLVEHHTAFEDLPFSGFVVVGNVFTSYVMSADPNSNHVTYERVWNEVGSLKDVFQVKTDNFLRINLDFPGDFWDDAAWEKTTRNFAAIAKAANNIGFKGILFDDEPYASGQHVLANYMSNFKFPKRADVLAHPERFEQWERDESLTNRGDWMDYTCYIDGVKEENSERCAYRNPDHSFKEHMDKVALRFKVIMQAMQAEYPEITVLVLHGPASAHPETNIPGHNIKPNGVFETNEYKGAMFLGFKEGLTGNASLHDLGEFYAYSTDQHFRDAYQWRKQDIASQEYSQDLDDTYRWMIPINQRANWSSKVGVGFMVSDYGRPYFSRGGYDTEGLCTPADVESRLVNAFNNTDDYVVFYSDSNLSECETDIRWLDVSAPVKPAWLAMMQAVYDSSTGPGEKDSDGDGVSDDVDNCINAANANQRDSNNDGFGNVCDADLDNNGFVNFADLALFKSAFGSNDADADFDGNGFVNFADLAMFKSMFGQPPGPAGANVSSTWFKPAANSSWHIQLQPQAGATQINQNVDVDIYDIDLFDNSAEMIASLQSSGKKVICYFSAGSYEQWRSDAAQFNEPDLGLPLDGWPGERWLDVRSDNVRQIMLARLDLAKQKGCDGVDPDNVDGYTNNTGLPLNATSQLDYNRFLTTEAHNRGLAVGLKNDLDQIPQLADWFDFSVNEQCHQFDECDTLIPFISAGKPVLNLEYASRYLNDEIQRQLLCDDAQTRNLYTLVLPLALDDTFRLSCHL